MSEQTATSVDSGAGISAWDTIRRGARISPELREGIWGTLVLALLGTAGRVVVPIAVQQTLDRGINGPDGIDLDYVGFGIVALFVLAWLIALAVWKFAGVEKKWSATLTATGSEPIPED